MRELAASELEKVRSEDSQLRKQMEENAQKGKVAAFFTFVLFLIVGYLAPMLAENMGTGRPQLESHYVRKGLLMDVDVLLLAPAAPRSDARVLREGKKITKPKPKPRSFTPAFPSAVEEDAQPFVGKIRLDCRGVAMLGRRIIENDTAQARFLATILASAPDGVPIREWWQDKMADPTAVAEFFLRCHPERAASGKAAPPGWAYAILDRLRFVPSGYFFHRRRAAETGEVVKALASQLGLALADIRVPKAFADFRLPETVLIDHPELRHDATTYRYSLVFRDAAKWFLAGGEGVYRPEKADEGKAVYAIKCEKMAFSSSVKGPSGRGRKAGARTETRIDWSRELARMIIRNDPNLLSAKGADLRTAILRKIDEWEVAIVASDESPPQDEPLTPYLLLGSPSTQDGTRKLDRRPRAVAIIERQIRGQAKMWEALLRSIQ